MLSDEDIEIWRQFKLGQSASHIAAKLDVGRESILKLVLLVESEMATSKFYKVQFDEYGLLVNDEDGMPILVRSDVVPPSDLDELEQWLR